MLRVGTVELKQANIAVPESPPAVTAQFSFFDIISKFSVKLTAPLSVKPPTLIARLTDLRIISSGKGCPNVLKIPLGA